MLLIDTNILLDVVEDDPKWAEWSIEQLDKAVVRYSQLIINPIIYAELSIAFACIEEVESFIASAGLIVAELPKEALFLAGKAFLKYRRQGGNKMQVLPDFFIGAHAAVCKFPLLTRDAARYRTYFSSVELITPSEIK